MLPAVVDAVADRVPVRLGVVAEVAVPDRDPDPVPVFDPVPVLVAVRVAVPVTEKVPVCVPVVVEEGL